MSNPRTLRCHQYVNRPYTDVRELLRQRAQTVFQGATQSAAARADALGASLHATVAGLDVGVDVRIHIRATRDEKGVAGMSPVTRFTLGWEAMRATALFPVMSAELSLWPLTSTETQLGIEGGVPSSARRRRKRARRGHRAPPCRGGRAPLPRRRRRAAPPRAPGKAVKEPVGHRRAHLRRVVADRGPGSEQDGLLARPGGRLLRAGRDDSRGGVGPLCAGHPPAAARRRRWLRAHRAPHRDPRPGVAPRREDRARLARASPSCLRRAHARLHGER